MHKLPRHERTLKPCPKTSLTWGNGKPDVVHRGITWRDFPGSDNGDKRINFTLFRHGQHCLNPRCEGLEGAALVERLTALVSKYRINGKKGGGHLRHHRDPEART